MKESVSRDTATMHFVLTSVRQEVPFRVFGFDGVTANRERTPFTVRADLVLARRYRIRLQDLAVICRSVLEQLAQDEPRRDFIYTEEAMDVYAKGQAARDAESTRRKPPRRPVAPANPSSTWRG